MGPQVLRIGVIGTGLMGGLHARNLASAIPRAELIAIADIDGAAAARCAIETAPPAVYEDYRGMLAEAPLDAVVICTPPDTHAALIEAAAGAGKHVFCEKPVDCDLWRVDRALEAVSRANVKLQVGFNRRFDGRFRRAQEAVAAGRIGRPLTLHLISRDPVRSVGEKPTFVPEVFMDTTIHDFDMARFLTGSEVVTVSATTADAQELRAGSSPHTAVTTLRFASGAVGVIDNSWLSTYGYDQRVEVFGTKGMVSVENEASLLASGGIDEQALPFFVRRYLDSYLEEMTAFVECVLRDKEPPVSGADGRAAVVLAMAARRSCREGQQVAVSEVD